MRDFARQASEMTPDCISTVLDSVVFEPSIWHMFQDQDGDGKDSHVRVLQVCSRNLALRRGREPQVALCHVYFSQSPSHGRLVWL